MFSEIDGSRKAIGDVDVVYHEGLYHLFHLVLPNHDFIAHAVSTDGINWRRVANALFIGDPGSWDDLMLWTMHVSADPHQPGRWRMFYTGLSRRDKGGKQRVGLALSHDLFSWTKCPVRWQDLRGPTDPERVKAARATCLASKPELGNERHAPYDPSSGLPITPSPKFYESEMDEGRHWVSFRDPFFYYDEPTEADEPNAASAEGQGYLLVAGRVKQGPVVRRGAVACYREVIPGHFVPQPALHHPGLYDDIEVPNLLKIEGEYYLIGSIREDAKIRYWHADAIGQSWRSYQDNVLMPRGNYAGRVCRDDRGYLLWNFFSLALHDRTVNNLMPPPKRLRRRSDGLLQPTTYERFEDWIEEEIPLGCVRRLSPQGGYSTDESDSVCRHDDVLELSSQAGWSGFLFDRPLGCFRFEAQLTLDGLGKCGLLFRLDPATRDGYYLSLDLLKGVAQLRAWDTGPEASGEHMMDFDSLQAGYWVADPPGAASIKLLVFGSYLELSVDGRVLLSLADQTFDIGHFGLYVETGRLIATQLKLHRMRSPTQSDDHLVSG